MKLVRRQRSVDLHCMLLYFAAGVATALVAGFLTLGVFNALNTHQAGSLLASLGRGDAGRTTGFVTEEVKRNLSQAVQQLRAEVRELRSQIHAAGMADGSKLDAINVQLVDTFSRLDGFVDTTQPPSYVSTTASTTDTPTPPHTLATTQPPNENVSEVGMVRSKFAPDPSPSEHEEQTNCTTTLVDACFVNETVFINESSRKGVRFGSCSVTREEAELTAGGEWYLSSLFCTSNAARNASIPVSSTLHKAGNRWSCICYGLEVVGTTNFTSFDCRMMSTTCMKDASPIGTALG